MHINRPGVSVGLPAQLSLGGDPSPNLIMELQTDAANWSYFSSTYLVPVDDSFDFSKGSILYISIPFNNDGIKVIDVRLNNNEITAYLLQEDNGFPGYDVGAKVTFIVEIDTVLDDLQSLKAVTYFSYNNVLVQMLAIFDLLVLLRVGFLIAKRRDLNFHQFIKIVLPNE